MYDSDSGAGFRVLNSDIDKFKGVFGFWFGLETGLGTLIFGTGI